MERRRKHDGIVTVLVNLVEGNVEWVGDDFSEALEQSRRTGHPIWEHDEHRGQFIVHPTHPFPASPGARRWSYY